MQEILYMNVEGGEGGDMYRLYPWPAGYKTRYIPRERSVLEWSRGSAEGEARGTSEAERKHWPLPRDVTGLTFHWPGIQLTYTMLRLPYSGLFSWGANFRYFRDSSTSHEIFHPQKFQPIIALRCNT